MPTPLVLARSFKEAHAFAANELGLRVGHYRVVNTAGTLKAVRGVDLHLVPGWDKAPQHFAIKSALRYAKGLNIIDHSEQVQEPAAPVEPAVETDFFDGVDVPPLPPEEPEPTPTCVDCGLTPCEEDCKAAVPEAVAQVTQDDEPRELGPHGNATTVSLGEALAMQDPALADEPAEKPKSKKRRSRCKDCGNLHYKDEPCPEAD